MKKQISILTDFPRFPARWKTSSGEEGQASMVLAGTTFKDFFRLIPEIRRADLLLIDGSIDRLFSLVSFFLLFPFLRKPIVIVDLVLRAPRKPRHRVTLVLKKWLLRRVDHFIHFFKKSQGYERLYGITDARSSYIPFKANLYGNPLVNDSSIPDTDEYVYAAGRSLRDYDTFFKALSQLGYPAAIPQPDFDKLHEHGARFTWDPRRLPANIQFLPDDGSPRSWIQNLRRARVVVIPVLKESLNPSGISVYLDAMLLKKCVVISTGPGVSDVLENQVIQVPPEDPVALTEAIRRAWEDSAYREAVALRGHAYAQSLGGEAELMNRILESTVSWFLGSAKRVRGPGRTSGEAR